MKKLIIAILLLLPSIDGFSQLGIGISSGGFGMGMNIPLNGRRNSPRNNRLENQVQQMKHDLDLNDDQVLKVRGLLIDRDRDRERGNKMSNEEFDNRMKEILTPEEYNKYQELKQQKREGKKESKQEAKKEPLPESDWDDVYR